ncbi:MAG: hypothetical protein ACREN3_11230 [Gemmatimonadaceae bacterium]
MLAVHPAPTPVVLGTALTFDADDTPVFTRDGNTVFFDRQVGAHKFVMIAHRVHGVWQPPRVTPFSGHRFDQNPVLSPDGSYLLFDSDRPVRPGAKPLVQSYFGRPQPGSNIWRVNRRGDGWSKPVWLGPVVNDGTFIDFPDIVADGSLYFLKWDRGAVHVFRSQFRRGTYLSAVRVPIGNDSVSTHDAAVAPDESFMIVDYGRVKGGLGRLSIAYRQGDGWSAPVDLGSAANADLPWGARLSPDGRTVYYTGASKIWSLALGSWVSTRGPPTAGPTARVQLALGRASAPVDGPWKFHTGDDQGWAAPNFDDSSWETVDLSAPAGAHDSDVGLAGYVPGWQARGHRGYAGFAWYRIRVTVHAPAGDTLALCGPFYVDNAYQLFVNGRLIGTAGRFNGPRPVATNLHLPRLFVLAPSLAPSGPDGTRTVVLAVRVWMDPLMLADPAAGGLHIAPALGTIAGAEAVYHAQWRSMFDGYVVDAAEAVLFLVLAAMTCTLIPFDPDDHAYRWLAAALVLLALARGNQAVFFWWQFESLAAFQLATAVTFTPLALAAWTIAWWRWFRLRDPAWGPKAIGALAAVYVVAEILLGSWFGGVFPHWVLAGVSDCVKGARLGLLGLTVFLVARGLAPPGRGKWIALVAIVLVSIGLYGSELSLVHVPGIWFPFGVGVSRTQYAYVAFDVALFALLLERLYALGRRRTVTG